MKKYIEPKRLILREIVKYDVQSIFELNSDPEAHRFLGNQPITSLKESESTIEYIMNQYKINEIGRWALIEKATNELLRSRIQIIKKFWGKGIGKNCRCQIFTI